MTCTPYYDRMRQALRLQFRNKPTGGSASALFLKSLFFLYGVVAILGGGYRGIAWMHLQPQTSLQAVGYLVALLLVGYTQLVMLLFIFKVLWYFFTD